MFNQFIANQSAAAINAQKGVVKNVALNEHEISVLISSLMAAHNTFKRDGREYYANIADECFELFEKFNALADGK